MSAPRGEDGDRYELVVRSGRISVLYGHLRAAGHGGRMRLARLRRWLGTPQGQRAARRTGRGLVLSVGLLGGWMLVRRWAGVAQRTASTLVAGYRRIAEGAAGAMDGVRFLLSLRWLSALLGRLGGLLRWWTLLAGSAEAGDRGHVPCADCHTRIRADARVCYRCGGRRDGAPGDGADGSTGGGRRPGTGRRRYGSTGGGGRAVVRALVWTGRVLMLGLYHRCPDCRRRVHADARVCRSCGYRPVG